MAENRSRRTSKKKQKILLTAERLFLKKGIRAVTVENIVDEAQVSKATFYKYFRNKEDILERVFIHMTDEIAAHYRDIVEQAKRDGLTKEMFLKLFNVNEYDRYYQSDYALELFRDYPELTNKIQSHGLEKVMPFYQELIRLAKAEGIIRTDVDTDVLMVYTLQIRRMFIEHPQLPGHMNVKEATTRFLDLYLYGVMERDSSIKTRRERFPPTVPKKDLHSLVDRLEERDQKSARDFLLYLVDRSKNTGDE
ncbi:TetR family transcriptional regulator [Melghirimyces profundicolus]|uniref:TetR family transcriptional regulator n=1 Tax=Melghirimyces profundicolus TaxID=1242148 RepID=A0A2T6BYW8_9BACL|nr:TetR/AcrR family transcriptional regulator [Melghirimyces profundicolus]PTX61274.1 TetR family transcriptional regulator [Melghirimyces profundicolus]